MLKILKDTLQKKDGKWDKQALTMFASFIISIILGISNTVLSYVLEITSNPTADGIFNSFMMLTGAMSGINVYNKVVDNKITKEEEKDA